MRALVSRLVDILWLGATRVGDAVTATWLAACGAAYPLFRWFFWSLFLSFLPFLGTVAVYNIGAVGALRLVDFVGSGQLFPTSIAIMLGGVKELSAATEKVRARRRDFINWASVASCVFIGICYGYVLNKVGSGSLTQADKMDVMKYTIYIFWASVIVAALAVMIASPPAPRRSADSRVEVS